MPSQRGTRTSSRRGGRGRGGGKAQPTKPHTTTTTKGVKKTQPTPRKRQLKPHMAAALSSIAEETDEQSFQTVDPSTTAEPTITRLTHPNPTTFTPTPLSLFFIHLASPSISTTPETETLALNLIEYFLNLETFPPELWGGRLHAVAFCLASALTGVENGVERIAGAVGVQAQGLWEEFGVEGVVVPVEEVERGVRVILDRRGEVMGCVGGFWERLRGLDLEVERGGAGAVEGEGVGEVGEGVEEDVLVDFDTYQEPELEEGREGVV